VRGSLVSPHLNNITFCIKRANEEGHRESREPMSQFVIHQLLNIYGIGRVGCENKTETGKSHPCTYGRVFHKIAIPRFAQLIAENLISFWVH
jgi:hypothetical protein